MTYGIISMIYICIPGQAGEIVQVLTQYIEL